MSENIENKELYREKIDKKIVHVALNDGLIINLDDGKSIVLSDYHGRDCCENVYADFEVINSYKKDIIGKEFKEMVIKGVSEMGFLICLYEDWDKGVKVFIPCYNFQNGYYSSDLELLIESNGVKKEIDISDLVEDHIN